MYRRCLCLCKCYHCGFCTLSLFILLKCVCLGLNIKDPMRDRAKKHFRLQGKINRRWKALSKSLCVSDGQSGIKLVCVCECVCMSVCEYNNVCVCLCVRVCNTSKYAYTLIIHIFTGANPEHRLQLHIVSVTSPFSLVDDSLT